MVPWKDGYFPEIEEHAVVLKQAGAPYLKEFEVYLGNDFARHVVEALSSMVRLEQLTIDDLCCKTAVDAFIDLMLYYNSALLTELRVLHIFGPIHEAESFFAALAKSQAFLNVEKLSFLRLEEESEEWQRKQWEELLDGLSMALSSGGFPNLKFLKLVHINIGAAEAMRRLLRSLQKSPCAKTLTGIQLEKCDVSMEIIKILGELVTRGDLSLIYLSLADNCEIGDLGVAHLLQCYIEAVDADLEMLQLANVGLGDEGVKALVSASKSGILQNIVYLDLSGNVNITDRGVFDLIWALRAGHLTTLDFLHVGGTGIYAGQALAGAVLQHCPKMRTLGLPHTIDDYERVVINSLVQEKKGLQVLFNQGSERHN
jgi:hypothetical protein